MKTKKNGIIIKGLIITLFFLMVPMIAAANGNSEKTYPEALESEFAEIARSLETGEIERVEALERLREFRTDYGRENNEDYQTMEELMLKVQTREMTALQAREQLKLLDECKEENSQIKLQAQVQNTNQIKHQNTTQIQSQINQPSSSGNGSGQSSGGSSGKAKSKK